MAMAGAHFRIIPSCYNPLIRIILTPLLVLLCLVSIASAAERPVTTKVKTVVRVDPRTGRLVRSTYALAPVRPAATLVSGPLVAPITSISSPMLTASQMVPVAQVPVAQVPVQPRVVESMVVAPRSISASGLVAPMPALPRMPTPPARIREIVEEKSRLHGLDPLLVHSVIRAESNYNPYAISPKGAEGLMQLIPSTASRFGVRDAFDPEQNIEGGVRYLKYLQSLFSDERLVLAAYNAGEGAVSKYGWIPPYAETQDYVYKVGRYYGLARREQTQVPGSAVAPPKLIPAPPVLQEFVDGEGRIHITLRQVNQ